MAGATSRITVEIGGKLAASLTASLRAAQAQVSSFSRNVTRTFNDAARAGRTAFTGVTNNAMWQASAVAAAGIGVGLASSARVAMQFEKSMSSVAAKLQANAEQTSQLSDLAKQLGASTKYTASQAADAMDFLAMAGFKTNDILQATPGILNLAAMSNMDLADAADITSNILGGMGLEVKKTGRLVDVLAKASVNGNLNVQMMGESFKYAGPIMKQAGVSIEQAAAMMAVLGDSGIQAGEAGTGLRGVILRLAAPPTEAAAALQKLGISTKDAQGNLKPMPKLLAEIGTELNKVQGSANRAELAEGLFGKLQIASGNVLLESARLGQLDQRIRTITDSEGAATKMAAKMQDNLAGALTRLGSAAEGFQLALAGPNSKVLQGLVDGLANVVGGATKFLNTFPQIGGVVVAVGAAFVGLVAIAPFLASFIAVAKSLGGALAAMKIGATIAGWAGAIGPAMAAIGAAITGPIGIAVLAIIGLGLAFKAAYDKVGWFRDGVNNTMAGIGQIFQAAGTAIKGAFQGWLTYMGGLGKMVQAAFTLNPSLIGQGFNQALSGARQVVTSWLGWLKAILPSGVTQAFGHVANAIGGAIGQIRSTLASIGQALWAGGLGQMVQGMQTALQGVVNVARGLWQVIVGIFTGNSQLAVQGVNAAFAGLRGIFSGLAGMATGAFNLIKTSAVMMGQGIVSALMAIPGMMAAVWAQVKAAAVSAFQGIVAFIRSVPGMVAGVGQAIIDTIIQGVVSRAQALYAAVKGVFANVRKMMPFSDAKEGPFKYLTASGKAIISTMADGVNEASPVLHGAIHSAASSGMRGLDKAREGYQPGQGQPQLTAAGVPMISQPFIPQYPARATAPAPQGGGMLGSLGQLLQAAVGQFAPQYGGLMSGALGMLQQLTPPQVPTPAPAMAMAGGGTMGMSMNPTVNINVAGTNASADEIAQQVTMALSGFLSDAESGVRAFLND